MGKVRTIVLVLHNSDSFGFRDVELLARHINGTWTGSTRPRILCFWKQASHNYNLGNLEIIKHDVLPGIWSKLTIFSPELEQYRPFLYLDLDTAVTSSLEKLFDSVTDESQFITLEDFYNRGRLATGLVWVPANSEKVRKIWDNWKSTHVNDIARTRMDHYIRSVVVADAFWQKVTSGIADFKPSRGEFLKNVPRGTIVVCFHGKPKIHQAAEQVFWVWVYVQKDYALLTPKKRVTVIIPYKIDRGWLHEAVKSVPDDAQLILSQGKGLWPDNFNKALVNAEGEYIRYLHEDDMLTPNCIADSISTFESTGADFIHGDAYEITAGREGYSLKRPAIREVTFETLKAHNTLHSVTLMYHRRVFEKLGGFNASEKYLYFEELEFNLRCLQAGFKVAYCGKPLGIYRRHPQQQIRAALSSTDSRLDRTIRREALINEFK